jgi:hypothetical protein
MTWYKFLEKLNKNKFWSREEITTDVAEHWMQERFPGPYYVHETWDKERNVIAFGLHFENKEEEIAWKLKWG